MPIGTQLIKDLTGSRLAGPNNVSVIEAGEQALADQFGAALAIHNAQLREITAKLATWTTEKTLLYGGNDFVEMVEVDEVGTARPQKVAGGYMVGFPLRPYEAAWQGSYKWFQKLSAAGLVMQTRAMMDADVRNVIRQMLTALFRPTAYQWTDVLTDGGVGGAYKANVRPLLNADGLEIPRGPNGETFTAGSHTHYVATTTYTAAGMSAAILNVAEHYDNADVEVWIAGNLESGMRGFSGSFVALDYPGIEAADNRDRVTGALSLGNAGSRQIGLYEGRRVHVKPYMPAGYIACVNVNSPRKPLAIRYDPLYDGGNLALQSEQESYPLRASTYGRTFGPGVWDRAAVSIWKPSNGDTTYVAPTSFIY